ncbi:MAG: hypothetical protein IJN29_10780 [Akkermansia sp.]|nr:hypothetical protein [Akkermansia sp.]
MVSSRIAGKVADGCKATWTNAQRLPRKGRAAEAQGCDAQDSGKVVFISYG